jgi:hypothetical protein
MAHCVYRWNAYSDTGRYSVDKLSYNLIIVFVLYNISSQTSSIVAVVWVSVIKTKICLVITENISKVNNKINYTTQEVSYMNRKVMFNII